MSKAKTLNIHEHSSTSFNIDADLKLYDIIVEDMLSFAGALMPRSVWQRLDSASSVQTYDDTSRRYVEEIFNIDESREIMREVVGRYNTLEKLLDSWIGPRGSRKTTDSDLEAKFEKYYTPHASKIYTSYQKSKSVKNLVDLSTIAEIGLLNLLTYNLEQVTILEIGGGYGRLAEAFLNTTSIPTTFILSDAVPLSLMYCYLFLHKTFPNKKIGSYYTDSVEDITEFDCFVVPTWHLETLLKTKKIEVDLGINIQSMQEMSQNHVDYFLNVFDKFTRDEAFIYLNNNEEYIFKGEWRYPVNWEMKFRHETPWSWSDICPTTVFQVHKKGSYDTWNKLVSYEYNVNIAARKSFRNLIRRNREDTEFYNNSINESNRKIDQYVVKIEGLEQSILEYQNRCTSLETEAIELSQSIRKVSNEKQNIIDQKEELRNKISELENERIQYLNKLSDQSFEISDLRTNVFELSEIEKSLKETHILLSDTQSQLNEKNDELNDERINCSKLAVQLESFKNSKRSIETISSDIKKLNKDFSTELVKHAIDISSSIRDNANSIEQIIINLNRTLSEDKSYTHYHIESIENMLCLVKNNVDDLVFRYKSENEKLRNEIDQITFNNKDLLEKLKLSSVSYDESLSVITENNVKISNLYTQLEKTEAELNRTYSSNSWKLTAPLRWISRFLRKAIEKDRHETK